MTTLSEKLRRERELRGISLKQISEETKIGVRFLEALEDDKMELIPGEFYRRSYLRAYARYLGLDEDRAVNAYAYAHEQRSESPAAPSSESAPSMAAWVKWVAAAALVGAVTGMLLLRSQPGGSTEAPPPPALIDLPAESATGSPPPGALEPSPVTPISSELAPPRASKEGTVHVVLSVDEPCWLEVRADGEVVATGLHEEGFRREVTAEEEVRLWLGNAGGVSLWINDRPANPLGRSGEVRKDVSITPENYAEFVAPQDRF